MAQPLDEAPISDEVIRRNLVEWFGSPAADRCSAWMSNRGSKLKVGWADGWPDLQPPRAFMMPACGEGRRRHKVMREQCPERVPEFPFCHRDSAHVPLNDEVIAAIRALPSRTKGEG